MSSWMTPIQIVLHWILSTRKTLPPLHYVTESKGWLSCNTSVVSRRLSLGDVGFVAKARPTDCSTPDNMVNGYCSGGIGIM